jgi:hypothetical protein
MSTPRGIFENFPSQSPPSGAPPASPFGFATEAKPAQAHNPSAAASAPASEKESPFSVVSKDKNQEEQKAIHLPERRKPSESPFHISEPQGFGFEAPRQSPQALRASPFEPAQASPAPLQASPFQIDPAAQPPAAPSAFGGWPQAVVAPTPAPQAFTPAPQPAAPAPTAARATVSNDSPNSDSYSIKQLELRAIFGVDREMTNEEIIQRSRSLPGIRQVARVSEQDIAAVDGIKQVIANLGFGSSPIKLYSGSMPIEFIREGSTLLAVQTDGDFAPGVRETLILVARELSK